MANTKTATKRARQALKRNARNQIIRSSTKSALRSAMEAIQSKDTAKTQVALLQAIKTVSKAASKGAIPRSRAARKISRLTLLVKKSNPAVFKT
jgi:small subunit ribosomal protein S20